MHVCSALWTGPLADELEMTTASAPSTSAGARGHYRRIVEDGAIYAQPFSEGGAAAAGTAPFGTLARKVDGGWLVNGKKIFASLSGAADFYGVLCTEDKPERTMRDTLYLAVPADAPGVTVIGDWDPLGMRGTVVAHAGVQGRASSPTTLQLMPRGLYFQAAASRWPHMFLTLTPTYMGIAQAAYDFTVAVPARRGAGHAAGQAADVPDQADRGRRDARQAGADARSVPGTIAEARVDPSKEERLRAYAAQYTVMENAQRARRAGDPHLRRPVDAQVAAARAPLPRQPLRLADAAVDGRALPRPDRPRDALRAGRERRVTLPSRRWIEATPRVAPDRPALRLRRRWRSATASSPGASPALAAGAARASSAIAPGDRVAGLDATTARTSWRCSSPARGSARSSGAAQLAPRPAGARAASSAMPRRVRSWSPSADPRGAGRARLAGAGWSRAAEARRLAGSSAARGSAAGRRRSDAVLLVYTSGTTGRPKGALLSHSGAGDWNAANAIDGCTTSPSADHVLTVLPMFHVGGLNIQTLPALQGGRHGDPAASASSPARRSPRSRATRPTLTLLVPAVDAGDDRASGLGGRPISRACALVGAGSSVVPRRADRGLPRARRAGDAGLRRDRDRADRERAQPRADARAQGRLGRQAGARTARARRRRRRRRATPADGERGEVLGARAAHRHAGYWRDAAATRAAFAGGWFRTGDIGHRDADGDSSGSTTASSDLIISGGENVYPAELEAVLAAASRASREAAVVGAPRSAWGEVPVAVVGCRQGAGADAREDALALFDGPARALQAPARRDLRRGPADDRAGQGREVQAPRPRARRETCPSSS